MQTCAWRLTIDKVAQDSEEIGHGRTSPRFTFLYSADRDALLGHLACLLDEGVTTLRMDTASVWGEPNPPEVFGLADLRGWLGLVGAKDMSGLQAWLEE